MRLFLLADNDKDPYFTVDQIHNEDGYRQIRETLARSYDVALNEPDIQVVDVDLRGDRQLQLRHTQRNGIPLAEGDRDEVLRHVRQLWGYDVVLTSIDGATGSEAARTAIGGSPAE
jgi:spore cortex formation protein SpoVR/YcgB (stage V sporulation)